MNGVKYFGFFALGGLLSSIITWKILNKKYNAELETRTESVKQAYDNLLKTKDEECSKDTTDTSTEDTDSTITKETVVETKKYNKITDIYTGNHLSSEMVGPAKDIKERTDIMDSKTIHILSPDEFGDEPDYETVTLTYYSDKVLTNEVDEPVNNVSELIGNEALDSFGQYEDDSVFVRNDKLKIDFEILLDSDCYGSAINDDE